MAYFISYPCALIIHHNLFIINCIFQITSFDSKVPCYLNRICKLMVIMVHLYIYDYGCKQLVFDLVYLVKSSWNPNSLYFASMDHLFALGRWLGFGLQLTLGQTLRIIFNWFLLDCGLVHYIVWLGFKVIYHDNIQAFKFKWKIEEKLDYLKSKLRITSYKVKGLHLSTQIHYKVSKMRNKRKLDVCPMVNFLVNCWLLVKLLTKINSTLDLFLSIFKHSSNFILICTMCIHASSHTRHIWISKKPILACIKPNNALAPLQGLPYKHTKHHYIRIINPNNIMASSKGTKHSSRGLNPTSPMHEQKSIEVQQQSINCSRIIPNANIKNH